MILPVVIEGLILSFVLYATCALGIRGGTDLLAGITGAVSAAMGQNHNG